MLIKSPNKSHPFIKFFAFLFSLLFLLISCSKPAQETANRKTTAQEETTITLPEQNASESKEAGEEKKSEKNEAKIQAEKLCAESDEYKRKLDDLWIELDKKRERFYNRRPGWGRYKIYKDKDDEPIYGWEQTTSCTSYYDTRKDPSTVFSIYHCKEKVKVGADEYEYDITFKAFQLGDRPEILGVGARGVLDDGRERVFPLSEFEADREVFYELGEAGLVTPIDIGTVDESIIKEQVHGDVFDLKTDENSTVMIKLFEEYENTNYPIYRKRETPPFYQQVKFKVLDYVKANLTNSGYDEYLVLLGDDGHYNITRIYCYIVSEDKIIKDYIITVDGSYFLSNLINERNSDETENFGFLFSHGWVNDFNQNGTNEIYFSSVHDGQVNSLFFIEYNGEKFISDYITVEDIGVDSVNWYEKTINIPSNFFRLADTMVWDEKQKRYTFKNVRYIE